ARLSLSRWRRNEQPSTPATCRPLPSGGYLRERALLSPQLGTHGGRVAYLAGTSRNTPCGCSTDAGEVPLQCLDPPAGGGLGSRRRSAQAGGGTAGYRAL